MYLEHFKLNELPFRLSPDPAFLYLSKHHARAKAYMESTIWFTDGFVVITGEIGSGKTTLLETFLRELEKDVVVAQVAQTQVSPIEFLQAVLVQFGFSPFKMRKAELIATLNQFLVEQYAQGRKVMLIVDEAQNLSNRVLEEIRLLSGVETTKEKVLRIILAGQPELNEKLDSPELVQLVQRIRLRFHLTALTPEETEAYILHRLEVAGAHGRQLFVPETLPVIYRYTGGVPRLINTLCDTALMVAFAGGQPEVGMGELKAAIDELQWVEFAARTNRMKAVIGGPAPVARAVSGDEVLARIIVAHGGEHVEERPLRIGRVLIGRTVDNDVQIESKYVSRHHCQITTTADGSILEDLNSTNGVYVKHKRVRRHHLNDGDVVVIGKHEIMYLDERLARARGSAQEATGGHQALGDGAGVDDPPDDDETREAGAGPAAGTA
ncbi:MAG TPA: AAA family ATPase [Steroidobacteraceae bacterium]|jgi:type II secretory pathway predicted ATPase ExeA|nr:AAA family ATPase [Steroidobacteraceae bacterium]